MTELTMSKGAGTDLSGEARAAAKKRRLWTVIGVLFGAGFASGFGFALAEDSDAGWLSGPIPAWLAVLLSVVWLTAMIAGSWFYKRNADELEINANLWGAAVGASTLLIGYPVWFLLWRGELAGEPNPHVMFVTLYLTGIGGYLWKKYR